LQRFVSLQKDRTCSAAVARSGYHSSCKPVARHLSFDWFCPARLLGRGHCPFSIPIRIHRKRDDRAEVSSTLPTPYPPPPPPPPPAHTLPPGLGRHHHHPITASHPEPSPPGWISQCKGGGAKATLLQPMEGSFQNLATFERGQLPVFARPSISATCDGKLAWVTGPTCE
jgi:hypothetical protein